jgi:hypothetical protein
MKPVNDIKDSVEAYLKAIFPSPGWNPPYAEARVKYDGKVELLIAAMYEAPKLPGHGGDDNEIDAITGTQERQTSLIEFLTAIRDAAGAKHINVGTERNGSSGCESCGYGSEYGWVFTLWD